MGKKKNLKNVKIPKECFVMIMRMFIQVPEMFIVKRTPCQNRASCRGFNGRTLTFLIGCLLKNILILMMWSVCKFFRQ